MLFSKPAEALLLLAIDKFKQGAKQWVRDFIDVYHNDNAIHSCNDATCKSVYDYPWQRSSVYTAGTREAQ